MFRFVATANTNGGGDESGLYQGTQRQNLAFVNHFILCEMGYPDAKIEITLLRQRIPSLPDKLCDTMVEYANEVLKLFMLKASTSNLTNTIEITFSTRSLLRWGDLTVPSAFGRSSGYAANWASSVSANGGLSAPRNQITRWRSLPIF